SASAGALRTPRLEALFASKVRPHEPAAIEINQNPAARPVVGMTDPAAQEIKMAPHDHSAPEGNFLTSRTGLVLIGFLAIGGFFLVIEHGAHVLGALPWLLLLACPLMHLFMHHGHGGHAGHDKSGRDRSTS